jgi:preprotein translocase subunit YajC
MGTIQEATEKTFKVEICPGVTIEIARASVSAVVPAEGESAK